MSSMWAGSQSVSNFRKYSAFYDLLYQDKDYAAEAEYVACSIRSVVPAARTILELGSGTGRHGRLLADMGFEVHGIDRSADMVSIARAAAVPAASSKIAGIFSCEVGDICTARLGRSFDAVISLFHVMSYQTTNEALQAAFAVAAEHLVPGGAFLFDVWHGPAVLSQGVSRRVKEVTGKRHRVKRTTLPQLDLHGNTVKVLFEMECEDFTTSTVARFSEQHEMRYLFANDIAFFSARCGMQQVASEEFLTGQRPSPATWSVVYLLKK